VIFVYSQEPKLQIGFGLKPAMEFVELILIPKLDGVVMHGPFQKPVDGTLCITGHHLILSTRKEGVEELWVIDTIISLNPLTLLFSTLVVQAVHKLPFLSKRDLCTLKVMYSNLNSSVFFFHACELTETYLTFSVPRFKWPVSFTGPHLNARIRAGRACFY
jgi:hypothetical protein